MRKLAEFLLLIIAFLTTTSGSRKEHIIFLEAESFSNRGGWVIDQQSTDLIGSPYILAHGLGIPVEDASTTINVPVTSEYRIWVRTHDWIAPWDVKGAPGKFELIIDNKPLNTVFGTEGIRWNWQSGVSVKLNKGNVTIAIHDLTGFDGRCDAIILSSDIQFIPPEDNDRLNELRKRLTLSGIEPDDAGSFDLVVVGGGMAGCSAALTAARLGCKVALIQNRPVLGGNNSSEVRVGLSGLIYQEPYKNLGKSVDEIGSVGHWTLYEANQDPQSPRSRNILEIIAKNPEKKIHNAGPASNYGDERKRGVIEGEPNISLFLNTHVFRADMDNDRIAVVYGKNIITGVETKFSGKLFADCTGDANLGFMAGADFRDGREGRDETGEPSAPESPDYLVMGTSVQWYAEEVQEVSPFPECPWAVQFNEKTVHKVIRGDWDWETGLSRNQVDEIEFIRDYALRVTFGNWDYLKNKSRNKNIYDHYKLAWVAYIGGKRESRRLMGDIVLKEQDIDNRVIYPDASFTTTWSIDLHYPAKSDDFTGEPFRSTADQKDIKPYPVPYRCLYSRNVSNMFMAGRNISVTHVALGTVRVQRTTSMMGEVVGMAASLCKKKNAMPRDIYHTYLEDLKTLMTEGIPVKQ
ncbi:MAG TPA: FAD-dependent oxidoreductase [Bacteroidales bacterium]|nr:FAD-dependent oxidoreductase [Bacteroidales bacterium]